MAFRIAEGIRRGEIDNRVQGRITGRLWVVGREEPIELDLKGNAHPDVAGRVLTFVNPAPGLGDDVADLGILQIGQAGDITASRKVRVFLVPPEEANAMMQRGEKPPEELANSMYIEWISTSNGRLVIESADYQITLSEPCWRMSREEAEKQTVTNANAVGDFINRLGAALAGPDEDDENGVGETAMDEFEWERFLKESDRRNEKYGQLLERYQDDPDCERIVAREMGWTDLLHALEAEDEEPDLLSADGEMTDEDDDWMEDDDDEIQPNPLTEGTDWVRDPQGRVQHPLVVQLNGLAFGLRDYAREHRAVPTPDNPDSGLHELLFKVQMTTAKLAGGLHSLAYDIQRDGGFIVACLKRALHQLHEALKLIEKVQQEGAVDAPRLTQFREDLFLVRENILALMKRFRSQRG